MADQTPQNFANHTKLDPAFHFVLAPIFGINFLYSIWEVVRFFMNGEAGSWVTPVRAMIIAFGLLLLVFKARIYSLKVQDRVIRLEERLRLASLLPEPLKARVPELSVQQLVGLRFASDGEVAGLAKDALDKKLALKEIKQGVKDWRPDYFRV